MRFWCSILTFAGTLPLAAWANPPIPAPTLPSVQPAVSAQTKLGTKTEPQSRFTTTVQIAVQERSPELTARGQQLVVDQLNRVFQHWPEFQGHPYRLSQKGKEVVFYVNSPSDMRQPMERAVTHMIHTLDGRVRVKGRSQFYRTSLDQPMEGMLEVVTDDDHERILSISAQSVPMRDILKEIRQQVGGFSYLIPGNCARQVVDWSFGDNLSGSMEEAKSLEAAMRELGTLFKLTLERQNSTFIFRGECHEQTARAGLKNALGSPPALLQSHLWYDLPNTPRPQAKAGVRPRTTEVVFPLIPLGQ